MNTQLDCSAYGLICACAVDGKAKYFGMRNGASNSLHILLAPTETWGQMCCIVGSRAAEILTHDMLG